MAQYIEVIENDSFTDTDSFTNETVEVDPIDTIRCPNEHIDVNL